MKTKLFCMLFLCCCMMACEQKNEPGSGSVSGTATVLSTSGRTSCEWVQLWENGPKWATFNVGATITDYANLTEGADSTKYHEDFDQAPYYNTANVGGLYAWNAPNCNGRQKGWSDAVGTGDVATTLWGSNWKTPTKAQLDTLCDEDYGKTTWIWCNGSNTQYVKGCTLKGYKVSGKGAYANCSIFLPVTGYFRCRFGTVFDASEGYYWSSTEDYGVIFNTSEHCIYYYFSGSEDGQSVRAILAE